MKRIHQASTSTEPSGGETIGTDEFRTAAQALLNRPWVTKADDPELFRLIKMHYGPLRDWFYNHVGYGLILTRHLAKLEKIPGSFQPWMGIEGFQSPRDYGFFTYGLWYLEGKGNGEQFLLSEMVDSIREHLLGIEIHVDWTLYDHRQSMARALKKLRQLQVLVAIEGEEWEWAREGGDSNVLYESSPLAHYVLRRFPRELAASGSVDALIETLAESRLEQVGDEEGADVVRRRHRVLRRLLLEPIVYDWQWEEEERRYVQTQRSFILRQLSHVGLEGSRFREGLYLSWPELTGEMALFPTSAAISDLALALAGELRRRIGADPRAFDRDDRGNLVVSLSELEGMLMRLKDRHGAYWTKDHREKTSAVLAEELIEHLEMWNLGARDDTASVRIYPGLLLWQGEYDDWKDEA